MNKFYYNLLKKYDKTGMIGKVKPKNRQHAQQIAYAIATKGNK